MAVIDRMTVSIFLTDTDRATPKENFQNWSKYIAGHGQPVCFVICLFCNNKLPLFTKKQVFEMFAAMRIRPRFLHI